MTQILKASLRDKQLKEQLIEKIKFASAVDQLMTEFKQGNIGAEELGQMVADRRSEYRNF